MDNRLVDVPGQTPRSASRPALVTGRSVLHELLARSAAAWPERTAIEEPATGADITYAELDDLSDRVRDLLRARGVVPGARVGVYMRKSIDAVASIFGALKAGAAYVPVDPEAPPARCAYVLNDCAVSALLTEERLADAIGPLLRQPGATNVLALRETDGDPIRIRRLLEEEEGARGRAPAAPSHESAPEDLAYILYTSGSTGKPKGVMLTHRAAFCFLDWCAAEFLPLPEDVYSSHAPLHFDLSIHDLYVPIAHGAKLVLIGEQAGKDPIGLAELVAQRGITVWYSTPSILSLLANYGKLDRYDFSRLRLVLFAGEVFPVPQLRALLELWPHPAYYNLYGPTETNVCTSFRLPGRIPEERTEPFPIGRICPPLLARVVDGDGLPVPRGEVGELLVAGPGVMSGYWNLPDQNRAAFLVDGAGERWYRTGDLVAEDADGVYVFHGRRDRMVKRRGYRIELGEIEAGLAKHADVREVAVVSRAEPDGVRIEAYLGLREGGKLSIIALKQFCAEQMPRYMVPDRFHFIEALPRTSTDKIDYQSLVATPIPV